MRAGRRADQRAAAVVEPEPCGVVGVDVQRAALLALHERRQVVHPGVVRAQLAAADQHQAAVSLAPERGRAAARRRPRSPRAPARPCPTACAAPRAAAGWCGPRSTPCGLSLEHVEREARPGPRRTRRRRAPTRSMKSSTRSGPRRGSSASISSAGSRPATREPGVGHLALDERRDHQVVERVDVRVRPLAGDDAGQPQEAPPTRPGRCARTPAASSWPRCAPRAGRARGRSATSRAARARAGSRRRGGWSRSRRCRPRA